MPYALRVEAAKIVINYLYPRKTATTISGDGAEESIREGASIAAAAAKDPRLRAVMEAYVQHQVNESKSRAAIEGLKQ